MDLRDYIVSPDFKIDYGIDGDVYVKDEKLSFKVKWQLIKYAIRKCIYYLEWAAFIIVLMLVAPVDLPMELIVIAFVVLLVLAIAIRMYYVVSHSCVLRDKIYLREVKYSKKGKNSFLIEDSYCKAEFNKILPDGTVSEHEVKASKEIYEKRNCIETARVTVFVYKYQPYFMVDDALKG